MFYMALYSYCLLFLRKTFERRCLRAGIGNENQAMIIKIIFVPQVIEIVGFIKIDLAMVE